MKTVTRVNSLGSSFPARLMVAACLWSALGAHAGLTVDVHLYHDQYGYYFYPWLSTNTTPPGFPAGDYEIASWQIPTNGSHLYYHATATNFDYVMGAGNYYNNFDSFLFGITNKPWSIWVTNSTATNHYTFNVTAAGFTSNTFSAAAIVTFPAYNQIYVTNQPLFTWTGPSGWAGTLQVWDYWIDTNGAYNYVDSTGLSPSTTSWTPSVVLPDGTNTFTAYYDSNLTASVVASTPTNTAGGQAISGWVSTAQMETSQGILFTVGLPPGSGGPSGHTNVVYYSFEDNNLIAHDFSGHGNDMVGYGWSGTPPYLTNDAAAGTLAVGYTGSGWQSPPTNLVAVLSGSFSVSLWARTTDSPGNDNDDASLGAGLLSANSDQVIPMALTGGKLAFLTGGGPPDTLHSATSLNTGSYVHLVVTRNQSSGEKKIYVNGVLDASDYGAPGLLGTASDPSLYLGMNSTFAAGFIGDLDEAQIYSGVLSADEVMQLYNNPGTVIPDRAAGSGNGGSAHYDFDEGTVLAPDVSGNGNDMVQAGNFGGGGPVTNSDSIAGASSLAFDGGSYLTPPAALLPTLAGNFSVSLWVNTTQSSIADPGFFDAAGIVSADIPGGYNDLIPVGMDEFGEVVFNTGNTEQGYDDELYSSATVNDGSWHHIVVTRDQSTGEKDIYIDGVLDGNSPGSGTTNLLNDPVLLTIGALADASNPDPTSPDSTGDNGYEGLLDDVQIYPRVLTPNEVNYLYSNPGSVITNSSAPAPVSVDLQLNIYREQDLTFGDIFIAFPSFNSVTPAGTGSTTNTVQSPTGAFTGRADQGGGSSSSFILSSFDQLINACTNGLWTLTINQGQLNEQQFHFSVSPDALTINLLTPANIITPTNGAVNVATNTAFRWSGPTNFSSVSVNDTLLPSFTGEGFANLAGSATNWPSPPTLAVGTNQFRVDYASNNFPGIVFTTPVDNAMNPISNWVTHVDLHSAATAQFVVALAALPVQLLNPHPASGGKLQFSFQTQSGRSHTIEARTNLTHGAWISLTNFTGDGSLQQFTFPTTNPPAEFFRVITQ